MTRKTYHIRQASGFSIVEVLVAAGILALLMAALVPNLIRSWENERTLAVANEFASWLNQVKTWSMRNDLACSVTINAATTNTQLNSSASLATVTPTAGCVPPGVNDNFLIPQMPAGRFTITASPAGAPNNPFSYTPRGASTNTNAVIVTFAVQTRPNVPLRCVEISPILGQVRSGSMAGTNCMID